ncbi:MAG: glycosyltransferase 87 family protein [Candidatus Sifarchaeia archaeon]|jgi:Gpi18-like mannosyltransferase
MRDWLTLTKEIVKKRYILIIAFCLAFVLRLFIATLGASRHWDFRDLTETGMLLLEGKIPYRDITVGKTDYPPLISYTMMVTVFLCGDFVFLCKIPFIIGDLLIGYVLYIFAKEWQVDGDHGSHRSYMITFIYLFLPYPIFESSYIGRFDSIPTLFLLLTIYFVQKEHSNYAGLCWGVGIMFKWFPVIIAPIIFLYFFKTHKMKDLARFLFITCAVCFLISLPFLILAPNQYISTYLFHLTGRAVSTDLAIYSLYSYLTNDYSLIVRMISTIIQIVALLGLLLRFSVAKKVFETPYVLIILSGLFLNVFVLLNRIINPQYFFWYFPLLFFLIFLQKTIRKQLLLAVFLIINLDVIAFSQLFMQWGYRDSILTIPLPFDSMILYVAVFHVLSYILFIYLLRFYTLNHPSVPLQAKD